jgi:hypothetical protein
MVSGEYNPSKPGSKRTRCCVGSAGVRASLAFVVLVLVLVVCAKSQTLSSGTFSQGLAPGEAAVSSAVAPIGLYAILPSSVGLNISTVHLNVPVTDPNVPTNTIDVPVTSFWHLGSSSTAVELVGYFDSAQQALADDQGHWIPSSRVQGSMAGQQLIAFDESSSVGTAGASRIFYHQAITANNLSASRSDVLQIRVDRVADLSLPAGVYQGTLHLRMVAY